MSTHQSCHGSAALCGIMVDGSVKLEEALSMVMYYVLYVICLVAGRRLLGIEVAVF